MTPLDTRVCPDCEPAGTQPFCDSCGLNLTSQERLPTREEWQSKHVPTDQSGHEHEPVASEDKSSEIRLCRNCFRRLPPDSSQCPKCGEKQALNIPHPNGTLGDYLRSVQAIAWVKRNPLWVIATTGVVLIVLVVMIIFLTKGGGASQSYVESYIRDETGIETTCGQLDSVEWECKSFDEPPSHVYRVTIAPNGTATGYSTSPFSE